MGPARVGGILRRGRGLLAGRAPGWDLPTSIGRTRLRNPVIAASGTFGYGLEYARYGDPSLLGAVVVKSLTVEARSGFPPPRVSLLEEPGAMLNAVGVPNPGVRQWAETILPPMLEAGVTVVASIWGSDSDKVVDAAHMLSAYTGPVAWELNLSCPNSDHPGSPVSHDPVRSAEVCKEIRSILAPEVGLWAKVAPDAPDVVDVGLACSEAGADAVTLTNTYRNAGGPGDPPPLGGGPGGISGSTLRHHVRPLVEKFGTNYPEVCVIASGGVLGSSIALDYLRLGARAVQVGTASFYDPRACHKIARRVVAELSR